MGATEEEARHEIRSMVAEAIGRFGVAGEVQLAGDSVVLTGAGPAASVELGQLPTQWEMLPLDVRQKRTNDIARELVSQRRASVAPAPVGRTRSIPILPLVIAIAAVAGGVALYQWQRQSSDDPPLEVDRTPAASASATAAATAEADRAARGRRVCEATRSRVMRGATVSAIDAEGWVVEMTLLRRGGPEMTTDPGLAGFVERPPGESAGQIVWKGSKRAFSERDPFTQVTVSDASLPSGTPSPELRGLRLTFEGKYVSAYFDPDRRIEFIVLANALAQRLGIAHGGLYARCAHTEQRHLGAWFVGDTPGGATASMVYLIGTYADSPHVRRSLLSPDGGPIDRLFALEKVIEATEPLDRNRVAGLVGGQGGMIAGKDGERTTLRFPFRDANRAARASRTIARELAIGTDR